MRWCGGPAWREGGRDGSGVLVSRVSNGYCWLLARRVQLAPVALRRGGRKSAAAASGGIGAGRVLFLDARRRAAGGPRVRWLLRLFGVLLRMLREVPQVQ